MIGIVPPVSAWLNHRIHSDYTRLFDSAVIGGIVTSVVAVDAVKFFKPADAGGQVAGLVLGTQTLRFGFGAVGTQALQFGFLLGSRS